MIIETENKFAGAEHSDPSELQRKAEETSHELKDPATLAARRAEVQAVCPQFHRSIMAHAGTSRTIHELHFDEHFRSQQNGLCYKFLSATKGAEAFATLYGGPL